MVVPRGAVRRQEVRTRRTDLLFTSSLRRHPVASAQTPSPLTQHPEEMILCREAKGATGSAARPLRLTEGGRGESKRK